MEGRKRPYRPITPGEIIKEELDARGGGHRVTLQKLLANRYRLLMK